MKPKKNVWFLYRMHCAIEGVGDYFGITTRPFQREYEHRRHSSGYKLRAAIELYGEENFIYEVICRCGSEKHARQMEREHIKEFGTAWPNGLNVSSAGPGIYSTPGYEDNYENRRKSQIALWEDQRRREIHSERLRLRMSIPSTRERLSVVAKRRWVNEEYAERQRASHVGKKHTEETKQRLREQKLAASAARGGPKGKRLRLPVLNASERAKAVAARPEVQARVRETWEKNRERNVERIRAANERHNHDPKIIAKRTAGIRKRFAEHPKAPVSDETRRKMSESRKGKKRSEATKAKMRIAAKWKPGRKARAPCTQETRDKRSAVMRAVWAQRKLLLMTPQGEA